MKRKDFLKGAKVVISDHALMRYLVRTEIMAHSAEFWYTKGKAVAGCKLSKQALSEEKSILEKKFRNSFLSKFLHDGVELRREKAGSKVSRCTFIAQKKGRTFIIITAYLQGKRNDFWKVGTEREEIKYEENFSNELYEEAN